MDGRPHWPLHAIRAYFTDPANSLEPAQAAKKAHYSAKLALRRRLRVLNIGWGWGGMALFLHKVAGLDVLGIALSEHQLRIARERAAAAGVQGRAQFALVPSACRACRGCAL